MISKVVASRYAEALFQAAQAQGLTDVIDEELTIFGQVLQDEPDFRVLFLGRSFSMQEKRQLIQDVFGGKMQNITLNFLCLTVDKEREDCLPAIIELYHQLQTEERGILKARLISAQDTHPQLAEELAELLAKDYGKKLEFDMETDPALLGGAVVRIEDTVIDLSLNRQFDMMRDEMLK